MNVKRETIARCGAAGAAGGGTRRPGASWIPAARRLTQSAAGAFPGAGHVTVRLLAALLIPTVLTVACSDLKRTFDRVRGSEEPVELPVLMTAELPFEYPPELFQQRTPGDVTLRLFIDSLGLVIPDSTQVAEPSLHPAFDSAAVAGSRRLVFRPARQGERRIGYTVLFPIKFRVPGSSPVAGDSVRTKS